MEVEKVTARWEAEGARIRARLLAPDVVPTSQTFGRSAVQMFDAILVGEPPPPPIGDTLGSVHGGWLAPRPIRPWDAPCMEPKVNMPRALTDRVPMVRAEGKVIQAGRRLPWPKGASSVPTRNCTRTPLRLA